MALDLTAEQKELGRANFQNTAQELTRRGFMKSVAATGAAVPLAAAAYFGYKSVDGKPVKAALIGCGDEGGVLLGEHNPDYLQFIAACEIRPFNQKRIIEGDPKVPLRKGFKNAYSDTYAKEIAAKHMYTDYKEMLEKEKDIEAVVIAVPLHLHAQVAIDCMKAGKHVLCEKLMARTIGQCKEMIKVAKETKRILSIGHQRHYSMLYAHATEVLNANVIGDIKHIRALWHRNFSWLWAADPKDPAIVQDPKIIQPYYRDGWFPPVLQMDYDALKESYSKFGYKSIEELIRWRLYNRTGGGLMAELGSHQLDACSIFLGKVHPISVQGVGTKSFFGPGRNDRSSDDHVFVTFEFPGKNYKKDPSDVVVVTYSSINSNGFEQYGECVMGTRGTLVVEGEQQVMLFKEREPGKKSDNTPRSMNVSVATAGANKPVLESSSTWGGPAPAAAATPLAGSPTPWAVSRGYKEEMEDFAYCVRQWEANLGYGKNKEGKYEQRLPRCHGEVAMADAIIALTSNLAMKGRERIEFKDAWFDADKPDVPDTKINPDKIED